MKLPKGRSVIFEDSNQVSRPKIMIALNTAWNLVVFRSGLIKALVLMGYEVIAVAPDDKYSYKLSGLGCRYIPLNMDNQGTHPLHDLLLFGRFYKLIRRERPCVFLGYTIKPNIYGSMAAHYLGVPVINNIAGLGAVFIKGGWLKLLVSRLYQFSLSHSVNVFFQNEEDRKMFIMDGLVAESVAVRLPGSGIDLVKFKPVPLPRKASVRFLLIARMLWDKGVGEFVEAARLLKQKGVYAEFCLLGFIDVQNPAAISRQQMDEWVDEGAISYLGVSDNVREQIADADCIVLPSYREGTPRSLLEAAAMARPIVTTDSVGCRDVVDDGVTGYLCHLRDALDLADKMEYVVNMSAVAREEMGFLGREKVEREFDEKIVIDQYLETIASIIGQKI